MILKSTVDIGGSSIQRFHDVAIILSKLWPLIPKFAKSHITRPAGAAITIALPKYKQGSIKN